MTLVIPFEAVEERARERVGGMQALAQRLPLPKSADQLREVGDDRYLSLMSLRIFRAGLKHSLVDAKWPAFEDAFAGFEPARVVAMPDEELEALLNDRRLIRHWGKLKSVRANAAAIVKLARDAGGMGAYLAAWPRDDVVGLWDDLGKRFAQLGGNSGPYFLRMAGKDTFLLTEAVVKALNHWDAFAGAPKSKAERRLVQQVFNAWHQATSRPLCQLSMILAASVD
ncbi:MAG TPA: DNA-3-methyladenine glycosylase I [Geminicoccaceae bacterium]|nr:DNA-3-methyladenine glycosylase I [Geminicoccaceae bacterium]